MEWIVLASRTEANIFKNTADGSLKLLSTLNNPLGRLKNKKLQYDKPGMSRSRFKGSAPHRLASENDPHEDAALEFSRKLANFLKSHWKNDHNLSFKIVAEAHLMGLIKSQFGRSKILETISWIEKDLQNVPPTKWLKILGLRKIPRNKDMEIATSS